MLPEIVVVWSDTDFAGCRNTRRSTSGGVVTCGPHGLKAYSSTQDVIAVSSGGADFCGIVRAGSHGFGMLGLCQDLELKIASGFLQIVMLRME